MNCFICGTDFAMRILKILVKCWYEKYMEMCVCVDLLREPNRIPFVFGALIEV